MHFLPHEMPVQKGLAFYAKLVLVNTEERERSYPALLLAGSPSVRPYPCPALAWPSSVAESRKYRMTKTRIAAVSDVSSSFCSDTDVHI